MKNLIKKIKELAKQALLYIKNMILEIQTKRKQRVKKKINWKRIETITSLGLLLFQIIYVFITYHTLLEMKEERNSSYRPTLVFDTSYYVVNYSETPGDIEAVKKSIQQEFGRFKDFENYPISQVYYHNESLMCNEMIPIKCTNVGVGPATDIRIWVEEKEIKKVLDRIQHDWYYTSYEIIHYDDPIHIIDEIVFNYKTRVETDEEDEDEEVFGNNVDNDFSVFKLFSSVNAEEEDDYEEPIPVYKEIEDSHLNPIYHSSKENAERVQYLLASAENSQVFNLPMIYSCLAYALHGEYKATWADDGFVGVYDIDSWEPYLPVIPDLPIKISYYDAEHNYHVLDCCITSSLIRCGNPNLFFSVSIQPR